jgi:hypothetical protein
MSKSAKDHVNMNRCRKYLHRHSVLYNLSTEPTDDLVASHYPSEGADLSQDQIDCHQSRLSTISCSFTASIIGSDLLHRHIF